MQHAELFVALLIAVVLVAMAARRARRVPEPVALVVGGIVAGLLPFAPDVRLDPDVIFVVFLPPILYPSAFTFAFEDVRSNLRPIGFLAVALVLATMAAIAAVAHLLGGIPWAPAFALGAVLAPTDPVAATSVIRASGAPTRLATILEGESLINDGTALTALKIAVAAVGGTFAAAPAVGQFVLVAFGGAAIGAVLGRLASLLRRRLDDLELETTIGVLLAYGAFIAAEQVHVSGVLAVVLAGFVMGRSDDIASPGTRMGGESFWSVARFLSESILFLLVGLAFAQVLDDPVTRGAGELIGLTAAIVAAALAVRVVWMFAVPYLARRLPRGGRPGDLLRAPERIVLGCAGLRGALSVAAALSLPAAVDGTAFPERSTVVAVAIASIVLLLVVPALGLPAVLRLAGLQHAEDTEEHERRARAQLAEAALSRLERVVSETEVPEDVLHRVRERYELRLRRFAHEHEAEDARAPAADRDDVYRRLHAAAVDAQRRKLAELRADGDIHGELIRALERDIDIEDIRTH